MALFSFGKKKEKAPAGAAPGAPPPPGELAPPAGAAPDTGTPSTPSAPTANPVDLVMDMKKQGMPENQIVQSLQSQGFSSSQIFDAMNQASMGATGAPVQAPSGAAPGAPPAPPATEAGAGQPQAPPAPGMPPAPSTEGEEHFEEIAESIVEEKWKEFSESIAEMKKWREKTGARLDKVEQGISDIRSDVENLHKAIVSKIGEYDKNLLDVGTEIKAMEKVFQKVLPTFVDNVSELSRVTKNIKSSKSKGKKSSKK